MSIHRPLAVIAPIAAHLDQLVAWLNAPANARPLGLRPPVELDHLRRGVLPVFSTRGRPAEPPVRIYSLVDAQGVLVGVTFSYGWDHPDDTVREVDLAIPYAGDLPPSTSLEAITRLTEACFVREGATEVRGRVRPGHHGDGFARLFAAVGAEEIGRPRQQDPQTGALRTRILYAVRAPAFYASRAAARYRVIAPA